MEILINENRKYLKDCCKDMGIKAKTVIHDTVWLVVATMAKNNSILLNNEEQEILVFLGITKDDIAEIGLMRLEKKERAELERLKGKYENN